ncbi:hypothetical protein BDV30DRAFT_222035 [Aspergillus minisclerotigenes]|uniref:Uncharacterized protein n=1 Tax=Aspergillus minisclerotigenes TaxID=656917 RepID=A0A5N6IKG6_9EURO|nr:hypothetical protein BDV30DRAFT_222035 [Aspergillus minisclerotigenes]
MKTNRSGNIHTKRLVLWVADSPVRPGGKNKEQIKGGKRLGQARQNTRDAGWEFHGWRKAERREDSQMEISRDIVTGQFLGSTGSLGMLEPGNLTVCPIGFRLL